MFSIWKRNLKVWMWVPVTAAVIKRITLG